MSFARWILTTSGLIRYMHPTDEELKSLITIPRDKKNKKGSRRDDRNGNASDKSVFNVPRNLDIQLETTKVTTTDTTRLTTTLSTKVINFHHNYHNKWLD